MGIEHWSTVPAPLEEVWAWHERPGAFARLQAPWLPGRIVREASSLRDGRAELALPAGQRWIAQHDPEGFRPGEAFVDERVTEGLASLALAPVRWRHEHRFVADGERTRAIDSVDTPIGSRALRPMFTYRHRQLADDLSRHLSAGAGPLRIAMTGASGLIGTALAAFLTTGGHEVVRLVRHEAGEGERRWDPESPDPSLLEGIDVLVHLAGASILGRFDEQHRAEVRDSRVEPTRRLAELAAFSGVRALVSASAIGFYGPARGDERLDEDAAPGDGFLAEVVVDWEAATRPAEAGGVRTVQVRTGIVQTPRGGTLQLFRPLWAAGIGGPLAGGEQWQSWIDLDDLVDVYHRAIVDEAMRGPVNAVAPAPVRQREYAGTLGAVLHRPAIIPTPELAPRLLLGEEGTREVALADQRVVPAVLEGAGHRFRRPTLEASLRHQLGRR